MVERLLILGGTAEAADLAQRAVDTLDGVDVISSLAGRLKPGKELPGSVRVGGFGGVAGLADYLAKEGIGRLVDATHPFAATMSAHARAACDQTSVPRLMLVRPPWQPQAGDQWVVASDFEDAARQLPNMGKRVFLTTGTGGMEAFTGVSGVRFLVRLIEAPERPLPLSDVTLITGRPPHSLADELALMEEHGIDVVVTKQSGGPATQAKLTAARELGLPVLVIARPPVEDGDAVETVDAALAWLKKAWIKETLP